MYLVTWNILSTKEEKGSIQVCNLLKLSIINNRKNTAMARIFYIFSPYEHNYVAINILNKTKVIKFDKLSSFIDLQIYIFNNFCNNSNF